MPITMSLREAVNEVHNILTGLDLVYEDRFDIFHATVRQLNRSLRTVALEDEWAWYTEDVDGGTTTVGQTTVELDAAYRPRITQDDAVRLVNSDGLVVRWAYYLPRESLGKYLYRPELRVASTRNQLLFNRPLQQAEAGLGVVIPAMREPRQTRLPESGNRLSDAELSRALDCEHPDLVVAHAAWQISMSNPLYQPRAQTLEGAYSDLKYALMERNTNHSDSPLRNNFTPSYGDPYLGMSHNHPHSDRR